MAQHGTRVPGPRCIALVGPFQSGKTTLLEAILARTGAISARARWMRDIRRRRQQVARPPHERRTSVATTTFMDDSYTFIDCPGSVEFVHDMRAALPRSTRRSWSANGREEDRAAQLIMRELEERRFRAFVLNKLDKADATIPTRSLLQPASRSKLLLRQIRPFPATSSPGSSISRSNAPLSTRSTPLRRWCRSQAICSTPARSRASPCWRRWPTMTTS